MYLSSRIGFLRFHDNYNQIELCNMYAWPNHVGSSAFRCHVNLKLVLFQLNWTVVHCPTDKVVPRLCLHRLLSPPGGVCLVQQRPALHPVLVAHQHCVHRDTLRDRGVSLHAHRTSVHPCQEMNMEN